MHKISILAIIEPKVSELQINKFRVMLGFHQAYSNGMDIWIFPGKEATSHLISATVQEVTREVCSQYSSTPYYFSANDGIVRKTQ